MLNPLSWRSGKLKRVCRSSTGAEVLAAVDALDASAVARDLARNLGLIGPEPPKLLTDSQNLTKQSASWKPVSDKNLLNDMARLREDRANNEAEIEKVHRSANPSDPLASARTDPRLLNDTFCKKKVKLPKLKAKPVKS